MSETTVKPWLCKRCGRQLATIEQHADGKPRLVFASDMLPSLIRDHAAFVVVECPQCGEMQRWHKRALEGIDSATKV